MPYGYYTLLRIIICGVFVASSYISYERKSNSLPWIFGFMAIVFNPIIKIHFSKEIRMFVDIAAAMLLLVSLKKINRKT